MIRREHTAPTSTSLPDWALDLPQISTGLPWEVLAWRARRVGRFVARDGSDVVLIDGPVVRRFPGLAAACAAVAL